MDAEGTTGGILKLRELIEEHTPEVAFDFRNKFGISYEEIGNSVSWLEAIYLVSVLPRDVSSCLYASQNEWTFAVSREWLVLKDTYELNAAIATRKVPKPYPGPWQAKNENKLGASNQRRDDVLKKLTQMNPKENDG